MLVWLKRLVILLFFIAAAGGGGCYWLLQRPLHFDPQLLELDIAKGSTSNKIAQQLAVKTKVPYVVVLTYLRLSGAAKQLKAGSYEIKSGTNMVQLVKILVSGKQAMRSLTIVEGWTMRQLRQALDQAEHLRHDTAELTNEQIMAKLGASQIAAEGQFFPDTYVYAKSSSDLTVLKAAFEAMQKRLAAVWQMRQADLPLKDKQELLILASIVEKESAVESDRSLIAGVFVNRLRAGMPLQTDPTVIYGVSEAQGKKFDGKIRYIHLRDNNLWNTYVHRGLPPTPIAMPGQASLLAVAQPAQTEALFFVAKGNGHSHFSNTLAEHNQAVRRYILQK